MSLVIDHLMTLVMEVDEVVSVALLAAFWRSDAEPGMGTKLTIDQTLSHVTSPTAAKNPRKSRERMRS